MHSRILHGAKSVLTAVVPPIIGFQAGMTLLPAIHCDIWRLTGRESKDKARGRRCDPPHQATETTCMSSNGTFVLIVGRPVIK